MAASAALVCATVVVAATPAAANVNGTIFTWGTEFFGDLGNGGNINDVSLSPAPNAGPDIRFKQITSSSSHFLALAEDGTVWGWGDNTRDQVNGSSFPESNPDRPTPVQIRGLDNVRQVAVGGVFSLALKFDGTVWAWGEDLVIGDNNCEAPCLNDSGTPKQVSGVGSITQIAASATHALMRRSDGAVFGWGDNESGQLGTGDTSRLAQPAKIVGLPPATLIATGAHHSLVLGNDGLVYAFGDNAKGELGLGPNGPSRSLTPTPSLGISLSTPVRQLAAGFDNSFVVYTNGTAAGWGDNQFGRLGTGDTANRSVPTPVQGLSGATRIAAGGLATAALVGGHVWAWGANTDGELGLGNTTASFPLPQLIPNLSDVLDIGMNIGVGAAVTVPANTLTMDFNPSSATIVAGNRTSTTIAFSPSADVANTNVNLSVSGLPAGVSASFSANPASSSGTSNLTLNTSTSTAAGTYAITVTGVLSSTGLTTTKTFTLGVTPATTKVQVPFLIGQYNATAESLITAAGLKIGTETFDSYGLPFGTVADQSPAGGTYVELGSPVNLYVANGEG